MLPPQAGAFVDNSYCTIKAVATDGDELNTRTLLFSCHSVECVEGCGRISWSKSLRGDISVETT